MASVLEPAFSRYPAPQQRNAFFSELLRRVESLPGVRSAALGDSLPLSPYSVRMAVRRNLLPHAAGIPSSATIFIPRYAVSPSYFYTLGIPLLRGRTFTDHDDEQSLRVVVVNESLGSRLWPGEDPVGKLFSLFGDQLTVVGVVGNIRHEGLSQDIEAEIYMPYLQENEFFMHLAVRTAVEPASMASAIRAQVAAIDPDQPIYNVATLEQTLSDSVAPQRLNALLLGIFGFIALAMLFYRQGIQPVEDVPYNRFLELLENKQIVVDKNLPLTLVVEDGRPTQTLRGVYVRQAVGSAPPQQVPFRTTIYLNFTNNLQEKLSAAGIQPAIKTE